VLLAAIFVDAVPGGDVDDAVAAANYLRQLRAVQNGALDEHGSLVQTRWRANIENNRRITFVEQPGYEDLTEISRSSRQQHLHGLFPNLHHQPPLLADDMVAVVEAWRGIREKRAEALLALDQQPRTEILPVLAGRFSADIKSTVGDLAQKISSSTPSTRITRGS